jgi:hypothetical protein
MFRPLAALQNTHMNNTYLWMQFGDDAAAGALQCTQGWDLSGDFGAAEAADAAGAAGIRNTGFVWQLLGSWNASSTPLRPADDCRCAAAAAASATACLLNPQRHSLLQPQVLLLLLLLRVNGDELKFHPVLLLLAAVALPRVPGRRLPSHTSAMH